MRNISKQVELDYERLKNEDEVITTNEIGDILDRLMSLREAWE